MNQITAYVLSHYRLWVEPRGFMGYGLWGVVPGVQILFLVHFDSYQNHSRPYYLITEYLGGGYPKFWLQFCANPLGGPEASGWV